MAIRSPAIVDTPPSRLIVRGALASRFIARSRKELGRRGPGLVAGCIYDSNGRRIDPSQRMPPLPGAQVLCSDPAEIDLSDPALGDAPRLHGRTLYLGNMMNHYGHFVTETLSRLWSSERMDDYDHIVAFPPNADRGQHLPKQFHGYFLAVLGLDLSRVRILRDPARFDEICIPEQLWRLNHSVNSHLRPLYAGIRERHAPPRTGQRIFLSRMELNSERLGNIAAVEATFASFGFAVYRTETLDMAQQLRLYAGCDMLAAPSGSGMHNCLFARPGTLTIDVGDPRSPAAPTAMQRMADQLALTRPRFVPYRSGGNGQTDVRALSAQLKEVLGERPSVARAIFLTLARPSRLRTHFRRLRRRLQYGK